MGKKAAEEEAARRKAEEEAAAVEAARKAAQEEEVRRKEDEKATSPPKELLIKVYLDRDVDMKSCVNVMEGCTVADICKALADDDPTGSTPSEEIGLVPFGSTEPLPRDTVITERLTDFDLC